jgi:predicted peptidase
MSRFFAPLVGAALVAAFVSTTAGAQAIQTGFLDRTVTVDGVAFAYQVYVPRTFSASQTWPVILALHGGGEYGSNGLSQTNVGLAPAIRRHPDRFPAIVVFPQAKADGTPGWHLAGGRAALAAVDAALKEFNGDPSRVYLVGLSAGGNGSWFLASRHPERFAAAVIVCAWVNEFVGTTSKVRYPALAEPSDGDLYQAVARRVRGMPVRLFHGDADTVVPVDQSRRMFAALKDIGADVAYTELPGVGHNAWDDAYGRAALWEWVFAQRRR